MGYEYLNPDQALCVNALLIQISLNRFAVCKRNHSYAYITLEHIHVHVSDLEYMYLHNNSRYIHDTWHWVSTFLLCQKQPSLKLSHAFQVRSSSSTGQVAVACEA